LLINLLEYRYTGQYTKNGLYSYFQGVKYTFRILKTAFKAPQGEQESGVPDSRSLQTKIVWTLARSLKCPLKIKRLFVIGFGPTFIIRKLFLQSIFIAGILEFVTP